MSNCSNGLTPQESNVVGVLKDINNMAYEPASVNGDSESGSITHSEREMEQIGINNVEEGMVVAKANGELVVEHYDNVVKNGVVNTESSPTLMQRMGDLIDSINPFTPKKEDFYNSINYVTPTGRRSFFQRYGWLLIVVVVGLLLWFSYCNESNSDSVLCMRDIVSKISRPSRVENLQFFQAPSSDMTPVTMPPMTQ
jgi:hypothetical protein